MVHDIAYLKSFEVEWEGVPAALENPSAAAEDDDDDELDISLWCLTDPSTVPIKDLKIPRRGKLPPYLLVAAAIVNTMKQKPKEIASFIFQLLDRVDKLKKETGSELLKDLMTRSFTKDEREIYNTGMGEDPTSAKNVIDATGAPPADDALAGTDGAGKADATPSAPNARVTAHTPPRSGGAAKPSAPLTPPTPTTPTPAVRGRAAARAAGDKETEARALSSPRRGGEPPPPSPPRSGRPATVTAARTAAARDTDSESDELAPTKAQEPARGPGRQKQQARVKDRPMTTHKDSRERKQTSHYTPPDVTRVVGKKKRKAASANDGMDRDSSTVVESYTIPVSVQSHRAMAGSLDINKRLPKSYMSSDPSIDAPLPHLTLSGVWHAVSCKYFKFIGKNIKNELCSL
jgi:hypothetical protein